MAGATHAPVDPIIAWAPQPGPQTAFVQCPCFEVIYGGARGGGKTDASLGDFAVHARRYGKHAKGLFVRRTRVALESTIQRAGEIYGQLGAVWHEQKSMFKWPNGARLYFRYLDRDADADNYQGHDYTRVYIEELTQFQSPVPVDKLKATLRSAHGVPTGFRATCNPGGPGHTWVKQRYIDPGPWRIIRATYQTANGPVELSRVFIPAKLSDNPMLMQGDPLYVARLQQAGSKELVRAWLDGDWNIIEGAFFDRFSARNVVEPFKVPAHWTRFRSFDWGYAKPFSVGWWAVAQDSTPCGDVVLPRGALLRYREWYGSDGNPNVGLRMEAEEVAKGILSRDAGDRIDYMVADPSMMREDGGPSLAERMRRVGLAMRPADNTRAAGWDQMRARIAGDDDGPMLAVFSTCRDFLRTVPVLQHDKTKAEDLDTEAEDHIADEVRYACMSRPYTRGVAPLAKNPPDLWGRAKPQAVNWRTV